MTLPIAALALGGAILLAGAIRMSAELTVAGLALILWTLFASMLLKGW